MARKKTSGSKKADDKSVEADEAQDVGKLNEGESAAVSEDSASEAASLDDETKAADGPSEPDADTADQNAEDISEEESTSDKSVEDAESEQAASESEDAKDTADTFDIEMPEIEPEILEPTPAPPAEPVQQNSFVPMLLGGLAAGGIGFAAATYWGPSDSTIDPGFQKKIETQLEENAGAISALGDTVAALPAAPDLTELTDEQGNIAAALDSVIDRIAAMETKVAELDKRINDVEKRPMTEGASDAAIAAYERELKSLQDTIEAQRSEFVAMAEEARSMEGNAEETARATMLRAALSRVQTAIDSGSGFAPALGDLQAAGIDVPTALSDVAEDGVMSLAQLQDSFPDAARAALAASRRQAAETGEQSGFSAFLKNQLGTRSLEPREGNDPDAVLSRAEAAAREGRLADTLAEIEALPEVGRTALADWTANVTRRQAAISAVETLGQELN